MASPEPKYASAFYSKTFVRGTVATWVDDGDGRLADEGLRWFIYESGGAPLEWTLKAVAHRTTRRCETHPHPEQEWVCPDSREVAQTCWTMLAYKDVPEAHLDAVMEVLSLMSDITQPPATLTVPLRVGP